MTLAGESRARFSELEQKELAEYRPVNRFALIACVFGWIASLALIHPVLCVVPLLGAILAIVALRQLGAVENKQSGRSLAVIGLGLSLLFGSWAVARESSRELRLYAQARQFAEDWLGLLREGKLYEAHQLTISENNRIALGASLKDHYSADLGKEEKEKEEKEKAQHSHGAHPDSGHPDTANPDTTVMMEMMMRPEVEFETFFGQPIAKRLRELGSKARYEFRENVQTRDAGVNATQVEMVFVVSDGSDGKLKSFPIKITLERFAKPGIAADWRVTGVADPGST